MIRITDATLLALTKLRARKVRTGITIFVSALLFGVLIAALVTANGAFRSVEDFSQEGLNDRFLVDASANTPGYRLLRDKDLIARAQQLFDERIAAKEAAAEKLGLPYDNDSEQPAVRTLFDDRKQMTPNHPVTTQVLKEYYAAHPRPGVDALKQIAAPYHPTDTFASVYSYGVGDDLNVMVDGAEAFKDLSQPDDAPKAPEVFKYGLTFAAPQLAQPFLLPDADWSPTSHRIPIIITKNQAEQLLKLTPLDDKVSPGKKLARIEHIYDKATNLTFAACYRNGASQQRIQQAVAATTKQTGDNTANVIYGLPSADSCGGAPVTSDTRTDLQKQLTEKQIEFSKQFGKYIAPRHQKLVFQIVGISPDRPEFSPARSAGDLIRTLTRGATIGVVIPQQLYDQMTNKTQLDAILKNDPRLLLGSDADTMRTVEFASATDAKRFVDEQSCHNGPDGTCQPTSKPFSLHLFSGNTVALSDLKDKFAGIFKIAALVVIGLAAIIMSATIGRMIADGRRETAVFRAIGFKRGDIAAVYIIYTLLLAGLVALLALAIGIAAAYGLDLYFWQELTVQAKLAFGAMDASREFHLFAIDTSEIWLVVAAVFVAGLLSIILPLLRNIRRNPIKDMRDE